MNEYENKLLTMVNNWLTSKEESKENLHKILVMFFTEYEGKLSRNNAIFSKLMKGLDKERPQVIQWIKTYTTVISCNKDFCKFVTSDQEAIVKDGKAILINRVHLKDNFYNQKWYEMKKEKKETEYTMEDFAKAVESLKKKAEKNGLDYHKFLK